MSDDPRHRSRRRRQIQVELLESRALLSASSGSSAERSLLITPSSEYVNQQQGAFTVTLTSGESHSADRKVVAAGVHGCCLAQAVTVDFSASLESSGSEPSTAASPIFAPFNQSVTFPAGASTETVTVPIISTVATPDPVPIYLSATSTSPSVLHLLGVDLPGYLPAGPPDSVAALQQPGRRPTDDHKRSTGDTRQACVGRRARLQQTDGAGDCGEYPQLSDPVAAHDDQPRQFCNFRLGGPGTFESQPQNTNPFPSRRRPTIPRPRRSR